LYDAHGLTEHKHEQRKEKRKTTQEPRQIISKQKCVCKGFQELNGKCFSNGLKNEIEMWMADGMK